MDKMNSRDRVLAAINLERPDRIPTDIWATAEVWAKLREHFGDDADLYDALHIDGMAGVGAEYVGPPLPEVPEGEIVDYWGIRSRPMDYGGGRNNRLWLLLGLRRRPLLRAVLQPPGERQDNRRPRALSVALRRLVRLL